MTLVPLNIALPGTEGKKKARNMSTPPSDPVIGRAWPLTIALDGGTTNTRARLMQGGRIVATARRGVGWVSATRWYAIDHRARVWPTPSAR
jgi:hypothetical protein